MTFHPGLPHPALSQLPALLLFAMHLGVAARALTRPNRTPASRAAWVAVIMLLPLVGVVAYFLLGETSIGRGRAQRLSETLKRLPPPPAPAAHPPSSQASALFDLGRSINGLAPVAGNRITPLGDPHAPPDQPMRDSNAAIDTLVVDIAAAREHVHISFYIWLDDHHGGQMADAVCAASRRGVACRVMVDALGSRAFIRSPRWRQLQDAGVRVLATLDDIPRLGHLAVGRLDLRNHRKVAVIDNRIAFCGSQNCADPEFRVAARFAPWVDILLRCEGPVVRQAQHLFLSTWIAETGEQIESLVSAPPAPEVFAPGVVAQMFGTGPTTAGNAMSDMFVATLYAARHELIITTPYFVPDEALLRALCAAPRRGVRTVLVLPTRNNSKLVGAACYSTYAPLLAAGVEIYEYPLGLLHTKSITADRQIALVGSANMDWRSLQLNFENNLVIDDAATSATIRERQLGYVSVSQRVALDTARRWPFGRRLVQNAVGMMAPVL